ncbi:MAG: ribosome biogenesis GTPase Der [Treponema sp.]|jgi:GTP-binding protein|nr:ribosome biogenesis GTPase Der [Treponema sp.]
MKSNRGIDPPDAEGAEFFPGLKYRGLPVVVIAGRPNVGKSTLFNRLLHRRRAITDPTPGVTRDPVEADGFIGGKPLRLIDTGGFRLERGLAERAAPSKRGARPESESLDDLVIGKTLETIKRADLVILLLEAGELTAEDEEFIEVLRPLRDRLIVAVNKTEGGRRGAEAWNLLSHGFEKVLLVSAEHGDNIGELEGEIISRLDFSRVEEGEEGKEKIRIALLGKPNTGKSTLSNRLTSSDASIVSEIPGTTRDVVEGSFSRKSRDFVILDTAGIRRKSKVTGNIEYYSVNRAIKTIDEADIVLLMIDAQEGLTDQDKKIAALAHDKGRGIIMALNKWDLMPRVKNSFEAVSDRIRFLFGKMEYAPIVALSAKDGGGIDKLLNTIVTMYRQLNTQIETGQLNAALERWLEEYPPPSGPNTRFKVKYAVQSSVNPVGFIFFVSRPQAVGDAYVSYLKNKIRKSLGFSHIPVLVEIRASAGGGRGNSSGSSGRKDSSVRRNHRSRPSGGRNPKKGRP